MKNYREEICNIEEVTDEELDQATGAVGPGWFATITDDCPNSIIVCC